MGSRQVAFGFGIGVLALASAAAGQCPHRWSTDFGVPGATPGGKSNIAASIVFDDGTGPALYVGGQFATVDGVVSDGVAKWDGATWTNVSTGLASNANPRAFAIHDDGTGPALYAAGTAMYLQGSVRARVVKLTASGWEPVIGPSGTPGATLALASFDPDGAGEAPAVLVAGGSFRETNDNGWNRLAQWNGTDWSALGDGIPDVEKGVAEVRSLCVFDEDQDGPAPARLFIGGAFLGGSSFPAANLARWDGNEFSAVGTGIGEFSIITCMEAFDDGSGPALFAAGYMGLLPGMKWDGSSWATVGDRTDYAVFVFDMTPFDADGADPGRATLIFGGSFTHIGNAYGVPNIARWDGERFSGIGGGIDSSGQVFTLAAIEFDGGPTGALFAGGEFTTAGGYPSTRIALWKESANPADWNNSGAVNSQDFFDFVSDFFKIGADFNSDGLYNSQDFFDFLAVFFDGC